MKYRAVVSDLDGTLLNGEHRFSEKTKEIIKKVKESGRKIFIATGRHHLDALKLKKQLGLDSYLISSNGARIHNEHNEVVYEKNIDKDIVDFILSKECDKNISRHVYTEDHWYVEKEREEFKRYHQESGFYYTIKNFDEIEKNKVVKIFFISETHIGLQELESYFEETLKGKVSITLSGPDCLELMAFNVSKGEAIKNVMERLDIPLNEVIAFGDGLNDYEMLSEVGKGLLMGNAAERLKAKLPNNEIIEKNIDDGVAKYLEKNLLSEKM
ncbi:Cof-type HAD-IIB family hydrolase [uncultured Fusobacterium sp.]|uniref:Cof-type HAD-IIB family hydrolase n=1 Tax=uncultured Fusobacterium sp. TaxID=159267 RepID=UPI0025E50CF3|nr:Cof-type HAD-IIB family hydrolase [uncultured Fusobacterium sp.]